MSREPEIDEGILRELTAPDRKVAARFGCGCLAIALVAVLVLASVVPYTDYLWFVHDAKRPEVFSLAYATRGQLFAIAFVVATFFLYWNLRRAASVMAVYAHQPETPGQLMVANALAWIQGRSSWFLKLLAVAIGALFGLAFSSEWLTYLTSRHAVAFGKADPTFGLDLSFFVFRLPWWLAIGNFATALLLLAFGLVLAVVGGLQGLASLARAQVVSPRVYRQILVLGGILLASIAANLWLRRFEVGLASNPQFTGAGFAGVQRMVAQTLASLLFLVAGLLALASSFLRLQPRLPLAAAGVAALFWLLGVGVYPNLVQSFRVEPDKLRVEGPYARHAIAMTRYAYGLDRIELIDNPVEDAPKPSEVRDAGETLANMRLWDPDVLRQSLDGLQGLKPYYVFHDVDIDRYEVGGKVKSLMVAPRDIAISGLSPSSRTWVNERLQYTHGFGVVMTPVNTATDIGQPSFLVRDIPPVFPSELRVDEPRIYYSDFRTVGRRTTEEYAIVRTRVPEFDFPAEGAERSHRWTGNGGTPVGGLLSRLAFSIRLGDGNLLISSNILPESRILIRRNVLERASLMFPFLQFDGDPYIVLFQGRLIWILDAYTTTDKVPYSARLQGGARSLNYIRNSVKVTVDAYSGETRAFAVDSKDPILQTFRRIYPRLIEDKEAVPKGLERHFRYPEDLFMLQAFQLTQYHVTDPTAFLNNEDAWDMPVERGPSGDSEPMRAYYVQMRVPGEKRTAFLLILPFTPRQKINMSGWLAAHCDPEDYGRLVLVRFPRGSNMPGPAQMEAIFNQDRTIADINRQLNNDQSRIVPGNLLVVPIGNSVLYVKPLFLQSRSAGIQAVPELKKVILALKAKVVVGDTYEEALRLLFGEKPSATVAPKPTGSSEAPPPDPDASRALELFEQAESALRNADFAGYGELQRQLRAVLQRMAGRAAGEGQR
ncbi:MAG: UPF0182 family protein [Fimbriimonadales bacterium]|nr:UPF0182 family protein [Fimbriimonadales bacterium]